MRMKSKKKGMDVRLRLQLDEGACFLTSRLVQRRHSF